DPVGPGVALEPDAQFAVIDRRLDELQGLLFAMQLERPLRADGDARVDARLHRHGMEGGHLSRLRVAPVLLLLAFLDARETARGSEQDEAHHGRGHAHSAPPEKGPFTYACAREGISVSGRGQPFRRSGAARLRGLAAVAAFLVRAGNVRPFALAVLREQIGL